MSDDSLAHDHQCKQRIKQVFGYLKALNEHRNPVIRRIGDQPWCFWLDDLPDHPCIDFLYPTAATSNVDEDSPSGLPYLFRAARPTLTNCPPPPAALKEWLKSGWDDPRNSAEHLPSQNNISADGNTVTVNFSDDSQRVAAWERWRQQREDWRQAELPARRAAEVFDKLYDLHGRINREAERFDLMLGDGILGWRQQHGNLLHPVLLKRVQLEFDPRVPEFRLIDSFALTEFYTALLQDIIDIDPHVLRVCRDELDNLQLSPLDEQATGFLTGFVNRLSAEGAFIGRKHPSGQSAAPEIARCPVLFLRNRTTGFASAIDQVIASIDGRDEFCDAIRQILGCFPAPVADNADTAPPRSLQPERPVLDVLFGKPANVEQLRIAQSLDRHGGVLVQGPPGTGKSHTIANLIGHLLAQGKSVLVTSHTTKALRVLRRHIVDELRPLSVSVLDSDEDSQRQLEEAVRAISSRLSDSTPEELEQQAQYRAAERGRLIDRLTSLQDVMRNAAADEYRDVVVGGVGYSPSKAAQIVADGKGAHDWLPGPVAPGAPCPLSAEEVADLYRTNEVLDADDAALADCTIPDDLPTPEETARSLKRLQELERFKVLDPRFWPTPHLVLECGDVLDSIIAEIEGWRTRQMLPTDGWQVAAVDAGRNSRENSPWARLVDNIEHACTLRETVEIDLIKYRPEFPDDPPLNVQQTIAAEIRSHLAKGKNLNWFVTRVLRRHWSRMLQAWRVQGRSPQTADDFAAIANSLSFTVARRDLALLWDALMASHGEIPSAQLGDNLEDYCRQYLPQINNAIDWWHKTWLPVCQQLPNIGFHLEYFLATERPIPTRYGDTQRVLKVVSQRLAVELQNAQAYLKCASLQQQLWHSIRDLQNYNHPVVADIRAALEKKDASAYRDAYRLFILARDRLHSARRRRDLLNALHNVAPAWANAIHRRTGVHGEPQPPGDVEAAWQWRQFHDELVRRAEVDVEAVGKEIAEVKEQLNRVTNELISRNAWASQIRRTSPEQRQALIGWLDIIKRIGKGYGKRVAELRKAAQKKINSCRTAVPVWVMPLSRMVESFDFSAPQFDVVIIDEASQCDVMALLAIAIARRVVVVGDDEQVTPLAIGQKTEIVTNLIREHLDGIPNAELYDGQMSIYHLARQSFGGQILLVEHFRCVPDIIQFSNNLSYHGAIKPLREEASSPLLPHVVPYRVADGRRHGKINRPEALALASIVAAICQHPAYVGKTLGIISLLGDEQAFEMDRLLRRFLAPSEYDARRIVCGNSAQFQGDERDVVLLSMVNASGDGPLPLLDRKEYRQRYNVAASRARDQLWVVYSLDPSTDLKPGDLRRRLIEHALDPKTTGRHLEEAGAKAESPFEREVCQRLVGHGYRVIPQWRVGRYRIDLVVEGNNSRVAVECDGDRYHPIEKLEEDMARQAILERLGWRFIRIRGSVFYRDRESTLSTLMERLKEMGVEPVGASTTAVAKLENDVSIKDDIIRTAAIIQREMAASDPSDVIRNFQIAGDEAGVDCNRMHRETVAGEGGRLPETEMQQACVETASERNEVNDTVAEGFGGEQKADKPREMFVPQCATWVESDKEEAARAKDAPLRDPTNNSVGTKQDSGPEDVLGGHHNPTSPIIEKRQARCELTYREQLVQAVIDIMQTKRQPLKAGEIASLLQGKSQFRGTNRKLVNSVLYKEITERKLAEIDSKFRWRYIGGGNR